MKKQKLSKFVLLCFLSSMMLSSCNSFFAGNETNQIQNVTATKNEQTGDTIITITFTDEEKDPVSFLIPKGTKGEDGVSLKEVTSSLSEDNKSITLHLLFSDGQKTDITIPVLEGKGIQEVKVLPDSDGNATGLQFFYSDGTSSEVITLPRGKDGKDGNGISSFEVSSADEGGNMTVSITLDDGTTKEFTLKNGKDGVSVSTITLDEEYSDDESYSLLITYSDGYTENVTLPRERATKWYSGTTSPDKDDNLSKVHEGDFYLNKLNGYVYQYNGGKWEFLFGMKSDSSSSKEIYHTVFFDPAGGKFSDYNGIKYFSVLESKTLPLESIPIPVLSGKKFEGWYTSLDNPNSGKFTDLTPVYSDLSLYARYSE